jgi:hypothetical protein
MKTLACQRCRQELTGIPARAPTPIVPKVLEAGPIRTGCRIEFCGPRVPVLCQGEAIMRINWVLAAALCWTGWTLAAADIKPAVTAPTPNMAAIAPVPIATAAPASGCSNNGGCNNGKDVGCHQGCCRERRSIIAWATYCAKARCTHCMPRPVCCTHYPLFFYFLEDCPTGQYAAYGPQSGFAPLPRYIPAVERVKGDPFVAPLHVDGPACGGVSSCCSAGH